jgi:Domain of unknown function (DUF4252)
MKRLLLFASLMILFPISYGQKSIDALFDKYAGKEGFTTVTINGNLLSLARCFDHDADKDFSMPAKISTIRVLSQEDKSLKVDNFYDMVVKDLNLSDYEEFMRIKESDQDLRVLVRQDGNKFREFLLIAGGEDNAIIQITGDITLNEVKKLSENINKGDGTHIAADFR